MNLRKIASHIASKYFKIGDVVELVNKGEAGCNSSHVVKNCNYIVEDIKCPSKGESFLMLKGLPWAGFFSHAFRKVNDETK